MQNAVTLGIAAIALAACTGNQVPGLSQRDVDAIRAVQDKYVDTALAADWDAWITTLTADAVLMPANQPPIKGSDAIVAWVKTIPKTTAVKLLDNEIAGAGDVAYAVGTFTATSMADGVETSFNGARSEVYRRQSDGSWRMSRVMHHPTTGSPRILVQDRASDEAAIRELTKEVEALVNKRDFAAYAAMYTDDGDVIIQDAARVVGREALRKAFEDGWKSQPSACRIALHTETIRFHGPDTVTVDDNASFSGCHTFTPSRDTAVMVRRDGKWQIAALRIFATAK